MSTRAEKKHDAPTAPKKTWGGQWFPQVSCFVSKFVTGGQVRASKAPRFLAANRYGTYKLMTISH